MWHLKIDLKEVRVPDNEWVGGLVGRVDWWIDGWMDREINWFGAASGKFSVVRKLLRSGATIVLGFKDYFQLTYLSEVRRHLKVLNRRWSAWLQYKSVFLVFIWENKETS